MPRYAPGRDELAVWLYAAGAYALALIGAFGFAWLLGLDLRSTLLLVGAVAVIALFGSAIPILRLGRERLKKQRAREEQRGESGGEPRKTGDG